MDSTPALASLPDAATLYAAFVARSPDYEGRVWVGVTSTRIFCRLTCPARKPLAAHCRFLPSPRAALAAGFRACKRCDPFCALPRGEPLIETLMAALAADPGRRWRETDLKALGLDPSTVRRTFHRQFGISFLALARLARLRVAARTLGSPPPAPPSRSRREPAPMPFMSSRVIDAQLDAGFDSPSGFRAAFARLLGRPPSAFAGAEPLKADWVDSPLGPILLIADDQALHMLEFVERKALAEGLTRLEKRTGQQIGIGATAITVQIRAELAAYFAGQALMFTTPIAEQGTLFERQVWAALRAIPAGETRAYREVAAAIGRPAAMRAVARANSLNRLAILTPCHRVIGADGTLTGYAGGLWRKQWLIAHEQAVCAKRVNTGE